LPLKCAVVSLYSVVKQRLKCNTGKVCNCLIQFLLTMVLSVEERGHHFQHSAQRLSERTVFCYTRQALIDQIPCNRGFLSFEMRRGEVGWVVSDVSKEHIAFIPKFFKNPLRVKAICFFQNVVNHSSNHAALHLRKLNSSTNFVLGYLRCCFKSSDCTVRSESRCALRLRYADLVVSIEVAVKVCCCFTVFSC
jgi:hypothetical protein